MGARVAPYGNTGRNPPRRAAPRVRRARSHPRGVRRQSGPETPWRGARPVAGRASLEHLGVGAKLPATGHPTQAPAFSPIQRRVNTDRDAGDLFDKALSSFGMPDRRVENDMLYLSDPSRIKGFRFLRSVSDETVRAYHRFALSLRDVEDLLASRGFHRKLNLTPVT